MHELSPRDMADLSLEHRGFLSVVDKLAKNKPQLQHELGYQTSVAPYGYTLETLPDGRMVFNPSGLKNRGDRFGDNVLRTLDDGTLKYPLKTFKKALRAHPYFSQRFVSGPKRYRGEPQQVVANAERLGLGEFYGLTPEGFIEVKQPEILTKGINLQDIYRVDAPVLQKIDRVQALYLAGEYIRYIHENFGAIGQLHTNDIIFREKDGAQVSEPVLRLPDIVYNPKKYAEEERQDLKRLKEPRAVEMLDFLLVTAADELRKTHSWEMAKYIVDAVLEGYRDTEVIAAVWSLLKRDRPTLSSFHNKVRFGIQKSIAPKLVELIMEECSPYRDDYVKHL